VIEKTKAAGITPLEVMTQLMLEYWKAGGTDAKEKAAFWADRCAPYFHAKLASIEHKGDPDNPLGFAVISAVPRNDADTDDDRPAPRH
jgi:hypothetical protein